MPVDSRLTALRRGTLGVPGTVLLALFVVVVAAAAWLVFHDTATAIDTTHTLQPPSAEHPFGTDQLGRDVLARVLVAAGVDIVIGSSAVLGGAIIGMTVGVVSGWFGGWVDEVAGRAMDMVAAFPFIVLAIAMLGALGPGLISLIIAFVAVGWVGYGRIARTETKALRDREFILAARGFGHGPGRIIIRHAIPNVLPATVVFALSDFILAILATSAVGFFGLGVQQPTPEWGAMVAEGRSYLTQAWWIVTFPGLAIATVALIGGLFADRMADRLRGMA